jgi:hypothetical protein
MKIKALSLFLECSVEEAELESDYVVYTDEEADEACAERIKEDLWAFNSDFLSGATGLPSMVFKKLGELCENGNEAVLAIVEKTCGLDHVVQQAIGIDGRGHFLSSYDGNENEQEFGGITFYIYKV